jgi:ABC-type nitrate/sulfonate/bicarbonate transport system substrate-binding protein
MPTPLSHNASSIDASHDAIPFFYTICPVLVASNIAVALGLLEAEMTRIGVHARYLRSLENNEGWLAHYRHSVRPLFRDGGAITTIWARAEHADTTLIASSATQINGQIIVRNDASVSSFHALKGKRIGLPKSKPNGIIDFSRAIAEQGFLQALSLNGLTRDDVIVVDIDLDTSVPVFAPADNPTALWQQIASAGKNKTDPEVEALRTEQVDAIFSYASRAQKLINSGAYRVIEDLATSPLPEIKVSNGPYTMAIDTDFAHNHSDIVVAFLRAVIRAGQWIHTHRDEAATLFTRMTYFNDAAMIRNIIGTQDFVPNLSENNLQALDIQKQFLREHNYLQQDFSIHDWADDRYLTQALASLHNPA